VLSLSLVGRFWREALVDFNVADTVFDRMLNARVSQTEDAIKIIWRQAAEILKDHRAAVFDSDLVSKLAAAIRNENSRALVEASHSSRRAAQQLGACSAAFREIGRDIDWSADLPRADRPHFDEDEDDADLSWRMNKNASFPRVCENSCSEGCLFAVVRRGGALVEIWLSAQVAGVRKIDPQFLPSTLKEFRMAQTRIASRAIDFAALATSCTRLVRLQLSSCGISMEIDLAEELNRFVLLESCWLFNNDFSNGGTGIDAKRLPPTLTFLSVEGNARLGGELRGLQDSQVKLLYFGTSLVVT
jgi:hypothetical protein